MGVDKTRWLVYTFPLDSMFELREIIQPPIVQLAAAARLRVAVSPACVDRLDRPSHPDLDRYRYRLSCV